MFRAKKEEQEQLQILGLTIFAKQFPGAKALQAARYLEPEDLQNSSLKPQAKMRSLSVKGH